VTHEPRAPEIRIEAPEELSALAARLMRIDSVRLQAIASLVGLDDPGPPITVLLVPERADFAKSTPPWIAGFAHGADGTVVLFPERSPSYPYDSLEDVLQHEIAHVLIARAAAGQDVPRWFHEGLALAAERPWGLEDRARAAFAIAIRRVDASALDRLFEGGESEQSRAYAIAGAWMRDILRRHGASAPARILREMSAGRRFTDAYARATSETIATSATTFWRESWWYQAVPFFTSSLVLWFAVTALALFAIRVRRVRSAARRARWDAEERARRAENGELRTENGWNGERRTESGWNGERRTENEEPDVEKRSTPGDGTETIH
jgi:hypothetical protein